MRVAAEVAPEAAQCLTHSLRLAGLLLEEPVASAEHHELLLPRGDPWSVLRGAAAGEAGEGTKCILPKERGPVLRGAAAGEAGDGAECIP